MEISHIEFAHKKRHLYVSLETQQNQQTTLQTTKHYVVGYLKRVRDRGATLKLGGGGGTISDSILGGGAQNTFSY